MSAPPASCWYFAYASNLCHAIFCERRRMRPFQSRRARLDGWRLTFELPVGPGERGVASVEPVPGSSVWGAAYLLSPDDCERLDRSEGVHFGIYRRIAIDVTTDDGAVLAAYTYRSPWATPGRKPSPRYLGLILAGAREHALPAEWVGFLDGLERAHDEREPQDA